MCVTSWEVPGPVGALLTRGRPSLKPVGALQELSLPGGESADGTAGCREFDAVELFSRIGLIVTDLRATNRAVVRF